MQKDYRTITIEMSDSDIRRFGAAYEQFRNPNEDHVAFMHRVFMFGLGYFEDLMDEEGRP